MDLKEVDLDKLQDYAFTPNEIAMSGMTSRDKFINIKCLDNESIIPSVKAILLDKVKQAREEIEDRIDNYPDRNTSEYEDCLAILDKLIAESEEVND